MENILWYKKHASSWKDGLPVGNGRLAAMVLGDPAEERLALNHEWLWRGRNRYRDTEDRSQYLPEVRRLLLSGDYEEGTLLANKAFGGNGGVSGRACRVDPYQPAGDFYFKPDHGPAENYRRELDLDSAAVLIEYNADHKIFKREIIAHSEYGCIIARFSSEGGIGGILRLDRPDDAECRLSFSAAASKITMDGVFPEWIGFRTEAAISVKGGCTFVLDDRGLKVENAEEITVFINIGTNAVDERPQDECRRYPLPPAGMDWEEIMGGHARSHMKTYGRLQLELPSAGKALPTDERIALFDGYNDPGLPHLYFNYGRYLLCASSLNCGLPANLQGKWNEDAAPPWECDYHLDINLQMNYWPAESGNLQECTEALFSFIERMTAPARKTAMDLYNCKGICFQLTTDAWGRSTPEAYGWSVWTGTAAWMAMHMWWHFEYSQDMDFLKERCYPFLKEAAEFYETYLMEDQKGYLQIVPSQSPENRFEGSGSMPVSIGISSAADIELVTGLLSYAIKASELLGKDPEKKKLWEHILEKLPGLKTGSAGQLLEWNEEFAEVEPGHRHVSHLIGLFPGDVITPERTPDLYNAAKISLERRLSAGGAHTGWSCAWTACLFARCGDGKRAWEYLAALVRDFASDSLLDMIEPHHPKVFQIDGNFGGCAAVLEMLLQSYDAELVFLPALPPAWPKGKVSGIRARGGYTVDMQWKDGKLIKAVVTSLGSRICSIRNQYGKYVIRDSEGNAVTYAEDGLNIKFPVIGGETITVEPTAS